MSDSNPNDKYKKRDNYYAQALLVVGAIWFVGFVVSHLIHFIDEVIKKVFHSVEEVNNDSVHLAVALNQEIEIWNRHELDTGNLNMNHEELKDIIALIDDTLNKWIVLINDVDSKQNLGSKTWINEAKKVIDGSSNCSDIKKVESIQELAQVTSIHVSRKKEFIGLLHETVECFKAVHEQLKEIYQSRNLLIFTNNSLLRKKCIDIRKMQTNEKIADLSDSLKLCIEGIYNDVNIKVLLRSSNKDDVIKETKRFGLEYDDEVWQYINKMYE